jgi:serine protease AprX
MDSINKTIVEIKAPVDAIPVAVNGRVIDPDEHYAANAVKTDHLILTLYDVLTPAQHSDLHKLEVEIQEDLGNHNYLCHYVPSDLDPLRKLQWVRQVDVYRNLYKIPEEFVAYIEKAKKVPQDGENAILINVMPHHELADPDSLQKLAANVASRAGIKLQDVDVFTGKVQAEVPLARIEEIASDIDVRVIEQVLPPILSDDQANHLIYGVSPPPRLQSFRGENQVIAVIDTGFDLGTQEDCHPAFEGRIQKLISLGRAKEDSLTEAEKYNDPEGHGTHVCGTIVGHPMPTSEGIVGGVAPAATLVVSSLLKPRSKQIAPVNDIPSAFGIPYQEHGARIFSNSWGDSLPSNKEQRQYGDNAKQIDAFVRDNPDALIIFSAGNNHLVANPTTITRKVPRPTIGSEAAAKNCLTVGASGSTRKGKDQRTNLEILEPDKLYPQSSRGRTKEARIKPDVVAPGFSIFSARSRHHEVKYTGSAATSTSPSHEKDIGWHARSGTSHATPMVAGVAAILREMVMKTGLENIPAALLKAIIINGADRLPGVDTDAQGFGRVNLQASAKMIQDKPLVAREDIAELKTSTESGTFIGNPLLHGQEFVLVLTLETSVQIPNPEFKITLIYNDKPGAEMQNNLNLSVTDINAKEAKHGYESEHEMKIQNNVEQVVWASFEGGALSVKVTAQKIFPGEVQDFVLAWAVLPAYSGK